MKIAMLGLGKWVEICRQDLSEMVFQSLGYDNNPEIIKN